MQSPYSYPFTPKHQYAYSPYCSLYISLGADKENLFNNQSFFSWWSFTLFLWPYFLIQGWYYIKKLEASHSYGYRVDALARAWLFKVCLALTQG